MSKRENDTTIIDHQLHRNDADRNESANVDVQADGQSPAIFKLHAICCDDLFEWLSLVDLNSLGQTCKRMLRLTGLYLQENFKGTVEYEGQELRLKTFTSTVKLDLEFIQFVRNIEFSENLKEDFQLIAEKCNSLRNITFSSIDFSKDTIDCIKMKMDKIETIGLVDCYKNYYELLRFCPNLKRFYVYSRSVDISTDNDNYYEWMLHKYPKLKHLVLGKKCKVDNVQTFFELNTQIQTLAIQPDFLLKHGEQIINSKIKLDFLYIRFVYRNLTDVCTLINKLHENGVYKRLKLGFQNISQANISDIFTLRGLESLVFYDLKENVQFPKDGNIKEVFFGYNSVKMNMKDVVVSFPNLHRIGFRYEKSEDLLPLIQRLPQLKVVYAFGPLYQNEVIDVATLNEERKKLAGACKVTIYVNEYIYLEMKMEAKNLYANYNLIEIKCVEFSDMSKPLLDWW